jgi:hypothetical protein
VGGDVQEPVADGLGGGSPQGAGEADAPGPAQQVVGAETVLHPAVVVGGAVEGQAVEPAGFGVPDDLLGSAPPAVPSRSRAARSSLGVSVVNAVWRRPSMVSNRGQLGAGVGAFAVHDQAGAVWPPEVDEIGDLGDLGAVAGCRSASRAGTQSSSCTSGRASRTRPSIL